MTIPYRVRRFAPCLGVCLLLVTSLASHVQAASMVTRPGSIVPVTETADAGPPDPHRATIVRRTLKASEKEARLLFHVALKMRNFADLQQRLVKGDIISSKEFGAKYAPLPADYRAISKWLSGAGFQVQSTNAMRLGVFATGTVSQVSSALQVTFARVAVDGEEYTSAVTAPSVPAGLSVSITGITGLQPHRHMKLQLKARPAGASVAASGGYIPSNLIGAYHANLGSGITGSGEAIAIIMDYFPKNSDLTSYWSTVGVTNSISNINKIPVASGTPVANSAVEVAIDVEWSSSIAPGANIRVYNSGNLDDSNLEEAYARVYTDVVSGTPIHEMSMSYAGAEGNVVAPDQFNTDAQYFALLASEGITIFASSGDNGSSAGTTYNEPEEPANDTSVTGVGGTTVTINGSNVITSETAWSGSGGGVSIQISRPGWQAGTGVPAGYMRCVPDVACPADPNTGGLIIQGGTEQVWGGTSWSSPTWAGFCALINQTRINAGLPRLGLLGPKIYPLNGTSNFNDITSGSNGAYNAGVGYDLVTGLGTPNVAALAQTFSVATSPAVSTIAPGASATFTATSTGSPTAYQWQREPIGSTTWSSLTDGGNYSGSTTASLTISNASAAMSGDQFQCKVTTSAGTVASAAPSVLVVDTPLIISTFAGQALTQNNTNGTGTAAAFAYPSGVVTDGSGNVYVADFSNNVIREISPDGVVTTPYGNGTAGHEDGTGTGTEFNEPNSVAIDTSGNLYVADSGSNTIRKIVPGSRQVTTIAGNASAAGGYQDGTGTGALFNIPQGVAIDPTTGNIVVADSNNNMIRLINPTTFQVTTLAGSTTYDVEGAEQYNFGWVDATGTSAYFNDPISVAVNSSGNIFVADYGNSVVREVTPLGVVTTPYGRFVNFSASDGIGTNAQFNAPIGVWCDSADNLYVADSQIPSPSTSTYAGNNLIRRINTNGVVSTIAGNVGVTGTLDGTGTSAEFYNPQFVTEDSQGTFYIADAFNQTIRKGLTALPSVTVVATQPNAAVYGPVTGTFTVSRTGSTFPTLNVAAGLGGTAVSGTDYTAIPGTVTISPGFSSAAVTVTPLFNSQTASKTVQLTLNSGTGYAVGSPGSDTVTIAPPTAYQSWKLTEFGSNAYVPSIGGDTADPNGNGIPNILEYALGGNPLQAGSSPAPQMSTVSANGNSYLALTFTESSDSSLTYTVQVSGDLVTWVSGGTNTVLVSSTIVNGQTQVTVRDNVPLSNGGGRFMRLQVSGP